MTTEIQELSEKLAKMYGVPSGKIVTADGMPHSTHIWLAEDSGRISDLCDENGVSVEHYKNSALALHKSLKSTQYAEEDYANHPTKSAAARMARVRCLLEIGEQNG